MFSLVLHTFGQLCFFSGGKSVDAPPHQGMRNALIYPVTYRTTGVLLD